MPNLQTDTAIVYVAEKEKTILWYGMGCFVAVLGTILFFVKTSARVKLVLIMVLVLVMIGFFHLYCSFDSILRRYPSYNRLVAAPSSDNTRLGLTKTLVL
jgi:hypothetical protein